MAGAQLAYIAAISLTSSYEVSRMNGGRDNLWHLASQLWNLGEGFYFLAETSSVCRTSSSNLIDLNSAPQFSEIYLKLKHPVRPPRPCSRAYLESIFCRLSRELKLVSIKCYLSRARYAYLFLLETHGDATSRLRQEIYSCCGKVYIFVTMIL